MKEKAIWVKCNGQAHLPEISGNIDHCGICMPYWEVYPVCPVDNKMLKDHGWCPRCRKHYEIDRDDI